ncbi:hypothetical protein BDB00DRAFT_304863 [Zychaea mexicana]|uniref:uncharacterized protein n=1 Tax=Zychaea mexicana TaxID=64656 RepID=UPI0022FDDC7C|nr:uncharacterized protein BDB00DRAFT_304863 [Zychaea mexicana]KAI9494468.1 hypothetical protein BDB00DRAFT_304863 [Zychaea mexicana]
MIVVTCWYTTLFVNGFVHGGEGEPFTAQPKKLTHLLHSTQGSIPSSNSCLFASGKAPVVGTTGLTSTLGCDFTAAAT